MTRNLPVSDNVILTAAQATGEGNSIPCAQFKQKAYTISATGQGSGDTYTVKAKGSYAVDAPDFGSAATAANPWFFIEMINADSGASVLGSTGAVFDFDASTGNELRGYLINNDSLRWFTLDMTTYTDGNSSGSLTATADLQDNG